MDGREFKASVRLDRVFRDEFPPTLRKDLATLLPTEESPAVEPASGERDRSQYREPSICKRLSVRTHSGKELGGNESWKSDGGEPPSRRRWRLRTGFMTGSAPRRSSRRIERANDQICDVGKRSILR